MCYQIVCNVIMFSLFVKQHFQEGPSFPVSVAQLSQQTRKIIFRSHEWECTMIHLTSQFSISALVPNISSTAGSTNKMNEPQSFCVRSLIAAQLISLFTVTTIRRMCSRVGVNGPTAQTNKQSTYLLMFWLE